MTAASRDGAVPDILRLYTHFGAFNLTAEILAGGGASGSAVFVVTVNTPAVPGQNQIINTASIAGLMGSPLIATQRRAPSSAARHNCRSWNGWCASTIALCVVQSAALMLGVSISQRRLPM